MKRQLMTLGFCLLGSTAFAASTIGIVDSGTDFEHELLASKGWANQKEIPGNLVDDDRNGKVDDVAGWNFADGSSTLFVRDHLDHVNPIVFKLFQIVADLQNGTISEEDNLYWEKNVKGLPDSQKEALLNHLNFYGQYAHGTHVAGVASSLSPDSPILVGRMFPDDPVADYQQPSPLGFQPFGILDRLYGLLARLTNATFDSAASYLNEQKVDVANYSLGVPLQMLAKQFLALRGVKEPTADELSKETQRLFKQYEPKGRGWMQSSPGTLFVIAAGNDGADNDLLPTFPASVRAPNSITIAASKGYSSLATFSNYGAQSVDVAAPGVAIWASVPSLDRKTLLPMSGTSMAAPFVTGVAGRVKTLNPSLKPEEIKSLLMGTVDVKEWLRGKVISSGVVNAERAFLAATLSLTQPLTKAVEEARNQVPDVPEAPKAVLRAGLSLPEDLVRLSQDLVF